MEPDKDLFPSLSDMEAVIDRALTEAIEEKDLNPNAVGSGLCLTQGVLKDIEWLVTNSTIGDSCSIKGGVLPDGEFGFSSGVFNWDFMRRKESEG